jgi:hypothetical protein
MPDPIRPTQAPPTRSTPPSPDPTSFAARAAAAAAAASRAANAAVAAATRAVADARASRAARTEAPPERVVSQARPASAAVRPDPSAVRPASVVLKPAVTREEQERGRVLGLAAVGCASVVALVVTVGIFVPALGALTSGGIRPVDAASLPATILVCDHDYARSNAALDTRVKVHDRDGKDPTVVGIANTCPPGVCATGGACLDVVYVATTDGRYAGYALQEDS